MNELGMQIPLNPPKIDFDLGTVTHRIMVESYKNKDEVLLAKICQIAKENGVTTLFALDEEHIKEALTKASAKKVNRGCCGTMYCPSCGDILDDLNSRLHYCSNCGQKLDWEGVY